MGKGLFRGQGLRNFQRNVNKFLDRISQKTGISFFGGDPNPANTGDAYNEAPETITVTESDVLTAINNKTLDKKKVIAILDAYLTFADDSDGALTKVTEGYYRNGLDSVSRADGCRIRLKNDATGATIQLQDVTVFAKTVVVQFPNNIIVDGYKDDESIGTNGFNQLDIGNDFIQKSDLAEDLANFQAKWQAVLPSTQKKHYYIVAQEGEWIHLNPGDWHTLTIGSIGDAFYTSATVEINKTLTAIDAMGSNWFGTTVISCIEVEENWDADGNIVARFLTSGDYSRLNIRKNNITVAAEGVTGEYDFYCDGEDDEVQIQAAIDTLSNGGGNGDVLLSYGTFNVETSAITMKTGVRLIGEGRGATTIEKNVNDYAIKADGGSGTEIENIEIRDLTVTRNASDTNAKELIFLDYADNFLIDNLKIHDSYDDGITGTNCDGGIIQNCIISDFAERGIDFPSTVSTNISIIRNTITSSSGLRGIYIDDSCSKFKIINNTVADLNSSTTAVYGIYCRADNATIANNTISNLSISGTSPLIAGLYMSDGTDCAATGNVIFTISSSATSNEVYGIRFITDRSTLVGNIVRDISSSGTPIAFSGIRLGVENTQVTGNVITNLAATGTSGSVIGIFGFNVSESTIGNNIIEDIDVNNASNSSAARGIQLFTSPGNDSLHVTITGNSIRDIDIIAGTGDADGIYADFDHSTISANDINNVDNYGIWVADDYITITGNSIHTCDTGIEVHTTADHTSIVGNSISNCTTDTIDDNGTNTFYQTATDGDDLNDLA